ncbi:DUF3429 domain-containing protein [Asaia astilbis]
MRPLTPLAIFLGIAGLVPFIGLAMAALFWGSIGPITHIGVAMLVYGGCILSFLGAVHWGLALEQPAIVPAQGMGALNRRRLVLGVIPALWSWIAVYAGVVWAPRGGILMEMIGFALVLLVERAAYRKGALPAGYFPFRALLTVIVVLSLAACLSAPLQPYTI